MYIWSLMQALGTNLRRRDEGATMVEYAIMITLIAVAVAGAVYVLGTTVFGWFQSAANVPNMP